MKTPLASDRHDRPERPYGRVIRRSIVTALALGAAGAVALPSTGTAAQTLLASTWSTNANEGLLWSAIGADGSISGTAGTLPTPLGGTISRTLINADGTVAYVQRAGSVVAYARDPGTGALATTPLDTDTTPSGLGGPVAAGIALSPAGDTLVAAMWDSAGYDSAIDAYSIAADGTLTRVSTRTETNILFEQPIVSPDGESVYVLPSSSVAEAVYQYDVAGNGALSPKGAGPLAVSNLSLGGAVITGNGTRLSAFTGDLTVVAFDIDPVNGALTVVGALPTYVGGNSRRIARLVPDESYVVGSSRTGIFTVPVAPNGVLGTPTGRTRVFPTAPQADESAMALAADGTRIYVAAKKDAPYDPTPPGVASAPITASGPGTATVSALPTLSYADLSLAPARPPVAALQGASGTVGSPITLSASGSTSADAAIVNYHWQFGDGTAADTSTPTTTHTYASAGGYNARVTVTNSAGCSTESRFNGVQNSCTGDESASAPAQVIVAAVPTPEPTPAPGDGAGTTPAAPAAGPPLGGGGTSEASSPRACATPAPVVLRRGQTFASTAAVRRVCGTGTARLALTTRESNRACVITRAGAVRGVRSGTCRVRVTATVGGQAVTRTLIIRVK